MVYRDIITPIYKGRKIMKKDSIVYTILEKREKFGYISYIDPKDKNKLTELFNIFIEKLYDNLLLYLNEMTVSEIYPMVHNYLYQVLVDSIIKEVEPSLFKLDFCDTKKKEVCSPSLIDRGNCYLVDYLIY